MAGTYGGTILYHLRYYVITWFALDVAGASPVSCL